jgi:hypothetical protein
MESDQLANAPLQDYPDRSVWTTWAISYQAIREKHEATANLLLLWSFLNNKDLWHGLFATACADSTVAARMLAGWIGDIASSEVRFSRAMQLLRNYSLVEEVAETSSYATHPVVHQWAQHSQGSYFATELSRLSVVAVGWSVPGSSSRDYTTLQRRLLPHAHACSRHIAGNESGWDARLDDSNHEDVDEEDEQEIGQPLRGPRQAGRGGADVRAGAAREGGSTGAHPHVDTEHGQQPGPSLREPRQAGRGRADVRASAARVRGSTGAHPHVDTEHGQQPGQSL